MENSQFSDFYAQILRLNFYQKINLYSNKKNPNGSKDLYLKFYFVKMISWRNFSDKLKKNY